MNVSLTPNETTVHKVKLLIDGEWVESQSSEWHDIVNPATQQVLAKVPFATAQEVDAAISAAHAVVRRPPDRLLFSYVFNKKRPITPPNSASGPARRGPGFLR